MTSRWTEDDLKRLGMSRKAQTGMKPSKYRNQKTVVDGITFDSKKEAQRWFELTLLLKAGKIARLKRQQHFELCAPQTDIRGNVTDTGGWLKVVGHYVADFTYDELSVKETRFIVEDAKGMRTAMYLWKKRHFEAQYGLQIRET